MPRMAQTYIQYSNVKDQFRSKKGTKESHCLHPLKSLGQNMCNSVQNVRDQKVSRKIIELRVDVNELFLKI